jgi:phosphatidate cytidylyltransferase
MAADGEERGNRFDDLFDDLDRFFETRPGGGRGEEGSTPATEDAGATGPAGSQAPDEEMLPADWGSDFGRLGEPTGPHPRLDPAAPAPGGRSESSGGGFDLGAEPEMGFADQPAGGGTPEAPEPEGAAASGDGDDESSFPAERFESARVGEPGPAARSATPGEESREDADSAWAPTGGSSSGPAPGGEMSRDDWTRLRDVLGDEDEEEGLEFLPTGSEGSGGFMDYKDEDEGPALAPSAEGQHDLTLDDLRKAPPEYQNLPEAAEPPGPPESEAIDGTPNAVTTSAGATGGAGPAGGGGAPGAPRASDTPRPSDPGLPSRAGVPSAPDTPDTPTAAGTPGRSTSSGAYWDDPDIVEVERTADRLAGEFAGSADTDDDLLSELRPTLGPRTVKVGEPESMSGPTWEEPSSRAYSTESGPPPGGRDLQAAALTGIGLALVAIISLFVAKWAFGIVVGGVVLLGQAELYAAIQRRGGQPATALGLVMGGLVMAGGYLKGEPAMLFFLAFSLLLSMLWYMVAPPKGREHALTHIGTTMLGIVYVPFMAGFALMILAQPFSPRALTLVVIGGPIIYDIAAFFIGSFWGSRPLAPTISPKKSWEGLFGATVITFALAIAILPSIDPIGNLGRAVGLALVVVVFAPLGDLVESFIKRDLGVKDMGTILPGHGGVLDRIDSILIVAPAAFYFFRLIA